MRRPAAHRPRPSAALLGVVLAAVCAAPVHAEDAAIPIPGPLSGPLPVFTGAAATAQPIKSPTRPANRFLAADGRSGTGLAPGNGGASPFPGPLGHGTTSASALVPGTCSSLAFDARARLVAVCNGPLGPTLRLMNPTSLGTIATLALPVRPNADRTDIGGGTHFIVDADGSLSVPTNQGQILRLAVDPGGFRETGRVDLAGLLVANERLFAVAGGYDGFDWVAGNQGSVLTVPRSGGAPHTLALHEPIAEDLATDPTGTYVVTTSALYRITATAAGVPRVVWRQPLPQGVADTHSGRLHLGSGTPPAIMTAGYVAVADGLNPPRITVVRVAGPASRRVKCVVPVFHAGAGAIEAPLVVAGRSILAANQYGYEALTTTEAGGTSTGGMARVVVGKRGCRVAWSNDQIVSPSAQAVVSRKTGLLYTMMKPKGAPDAWNLTAVDWYSGKVRFAALAGEGLGYNSEGGPVILGPDGSAYSGSFGGITRFHDAG